MSSYHHAVLLRVSSPRSFNIATFSDDVVQERWEVAYDSFGINEVRGLIARAYQRPMEGERQRLIVRTDFITHEAQNALLKVLEEPPVATSFLFIVPLDLMVLPTLASRFWEAEGVTDVDVVEEGVFSSFLELGIAQRITLIETKLKAGDLGWQRSIKQGLIRYLRSQPEGNHVQMKALEFVTRMLLTRGASNKMLLEHAALYVPVS